MNKASHEKRVEQHKAHLTLIAVVAAIVTIIIFDLSPFGGNVRFYAKWIECGQKPVATDISLGLGASVKHYVEPPSFQLVRFGQPDYFCTPLKAELAGYSANSSVYEFPHINTKQN